MATATLETQGVTGTINYRLVWNERLEGVERIRAHWGGGPNAEYATATLAAEDFDVAGVFSIRGGVWEAVPLPLRADPSTPVDASEAVAIRDAVLDALQGEAPTGHVSVVNARKNGKKQRADERRILKSRNDARSAAIQTEIDELVAGS